MTHDDFNWNTGSFSGRLAKVQERMRIRSLLRDAFVAGVVAAAETLTGPGTPDEKATKLEELTDRWVEQHFA